MESNKYTKAKYRTAICEQGKTIDEIAAERMRACIQEGTCGAQLNVR